MFQYRRSLLALLLLGLAATTTAQAVTDLDAELFVQNLAKNAISTVAASNISDSDRSDRFRQIFTSAVDIPKLAKFVLSRYWQMASPTQQAEFLNAFEESQVLAWSQRFKTYNGEKLETQGAKMDGEGGWLVDSQIVRHQGTPAIVQWRLQSAEDGSLRITDIIAKGISMALVFRQDYTTILQSNGQDIDALLSTIRTRNLLIAKKQ